MGEQIAVLSPGVWKIRGLVKQLTGLEPVRWAPPLKRPEFTSVVGWGLKPTSKTAKKLAKKTDKTYVAIEDGFIRSVAPGPNEIPVSLIVDRSGVYYDATDTSDLEKLIVKRSTTTDSDIIARAQNGMSLLRENRISKYNHAPHLSAEQLGLAPVAPIGGRVLVVDQTYGDSSIDYGLADSSSFQKMFESAINENPDAEIIVKIHPEVVCGRKKGYLTGLANDKRIKLIDQDVNPWSLIELAEKVYVVTSQFGFEALLAGRDVVCFGAPFYAGWGLTDDRKIVHRRQLTQVSLEQLFAAVYLDYSNYIDSNTKHEIAFEDAVAWMINEREDYCKTGQ